MCQLQTPVRRQSSSLGVRLSRAKVSQAQALRLPVCVTSSTQTSSPSTPPTSTLPLSDEDPMLPPHEDSTLEDFSEPLFIPSSTSAPVSVAVSVGQHATVASCANVTCIMPSPTSAHVDLTEPQWESRLPAWSYDEVFLKSYNFFVIILINSGRKFEKSRTSFFRNHC